MDSLNYLSSPLGLDAAALKYLSIMTIIALIPGLLVTTTCFPYILTVFSAIRQGIGLQNTPSNAVVVVLSIFMTWHVMRPEFESSWLNGIGPYIENKIGLSDALMESSKPFFSFASSQLSHRDAAFLYKGSQYDFGSESISLLTIIPDFIISELSRAYEAVLLLLLPFFIIDIVVASILMAMGMMMVSPNVFSLPIKVAFFVSIDGWSQIPKMVIDQY